MRGGKFFIVTLIIWAGIGAAAASNLVQNGDFEGAWTPDGTGDVIPLGWTKDESRDPPETSTILDVADNPPWTLGTTSALWSRPAGGGNGDHTILWQPLSIFGADFSRLTLSLDVKVLAHNLEAGGSVAPAFEWPVRIEILYRLASDPATIQLWRHGWFIDPPGDSVSGPVDDPGSGLIPIYGDELVTQGSWHHSGFDLFAELPDLGEIIQITVGGAGHSFEGQADNIEITGKFWKEGYDNFAPSGMPDFSQKQNQWAHEILCGPVPGPVGFLQADSVANNVFPADDVQVLPPGAGCASQNDVVVGKGPNGIMDTPVHPDDLYRLDYCVPTAIADCLWWFDSQNSDQAGFPCDGAQDQYNLVTGYGNPPKDDHCPDNVDDPTTLPGLDPSGILQGELVEDLAWRMDTNGQRTGIIKSGTLAADAEAAVRQYIRDRGREEEYIVKLVPDPDMNFLSAELSRSQDLILMLTFSQICQGDPTPRFIGGHAVTTAGLDPAPLSQEVCISDPFFDQAELGGLGRVPSPHPLHAGFPDPFHNDARAVSHDCYPVAPTTGPFGGLEFLSYGTLIQPGEDPNPTNCADIANFIGQNQWNPDDPAYEPFPCDPSCPITTTVPFVLEISPTGWFYKADGWDDYAPSGVPDFDQKQGLFTCPLNGSWSYCGPTAVANSFWWYDSVLESTPVPPPTINDHYPLVEWPAGKPYDDHDDRNVEPVIKDLAALMNTDNQNGLPVPPFCGTFVADMATAVDKWLLNKGIRNDYFVNLVPSPPFDFVADEVEKSQDVVLLLGFWQDQDPGPAVEWVRIGGHYVTMAGVDRANRLVAFSDPFLDTAEAGTAVAGRVRGPLPHGHPAAPPDPAHNDALNVSHDGYVAVPTNSPGGIWGPDGYADALGFDGVSNFEGQNSSEDVSGFPTGPPIQGVPIQTEVEYALEVSYCPDRDGDGFRLNCDGDCDDDDPAVYPGAPEFCDGKDNDCNGLVDEGTSDVDNDSWCDAIDNCPNTPNPGQADSETAAGPDAVCGTVDDNPALYGPDGVCGTADDEIGDGVGDLCDNCLETYNPGQADSETAAGPDGDGIGDACDCAPFMTPNPGPPGLVGGVSATNSGAPSWSTVEWDWLPVPGAQSYEIHRGTFSTAAAAGRTYNHTFGLACNSPGPTESDGAALTVGNGFYYLFRSKNSCWKGPFSINSAGTSRPDLGACP
jgi:hypothetical protein